MLIAVNGLIKLSDFNMADQLYQSTSQRSNTCGTVLYMAPEVYEGETVLKSDVWALGISLIEMAEGRNPYAGSSSMQVLKSVCFDEPPSLSSSKWSPEFVDFVSKCLVKDANERWSVDQLMDVGVCLKSDDA